MTACTTLLAANTALAQNPAGGGLALDDQQSSSTSKMIVSGVSFFPTASRRLALKSPLRAVVDGRLAAAPLHEF